MYFFFADAAAAAADDDDDDDDDEWLLKISKKTKASPSTYLFHFKGWKLGNY